MKKSKIAILLLSACVCASCLVPAVRAADAASADALQTDPDTVDLAALYPADYSAVTPDCVTSLPDGGQSYNFTIGGAPCQVLVPPKNFNPLKATDADLEKYGFMRRPADPADLAQWTADMKGYKKTVKPNKLFKSKKKDGPPLQAGVSGTNYRTANWGGVLSQPTGSGAYSGSFQHAEGYVTLPSYNRSTGKPGTVVSWVGIGGYPNKPKLIQCGTKMYVSSADANPVYSFWWECLPTYQSMVPYTNMTCGGGDRIQMTVNYASGTVTFGFYNVTKNVSSGAITIGGRSDCYDGTTAEWIDERPGPTGNYAPLPSFANIYWDGCRARTSAGSTVYAAELFDFHRVYMYNDTESTQLSTVTITGAETHYSTWLAQY